MWSKFKKRYKRINITNKIKQAEKKENSGIDLLFKKEKKKKKENDFFYYYKRDSEESKNSKTISNKISKKCTILSSDINKVVNLVNIKSELIKKLNTFSLQKISKEYYRLTPSRTLTTKSLENSINPKNRDEIINSNNSQSSINYNKNNFRTLSSSSINDKNKMYTKIKQKKSKNFRTIDQYDYDGNLSNKYNKNMKLLASLTKNKVSEKLKKYVDIDINDLYKYNNKNIINLERFNDAFRIQMNNTCYKFIPRNHLKKLNELQRDNVLVRTSMEKIKSKLCNKLKDYSNKKISLKKYKLIKEKFSKEKNIRILSAKQLKSLHSLPSKIPYNIKLQNNMLPLGFKVRALYDHQVHSLKNEKRKEKIINSEKKKEPQKNIKYGDELLEKAVKKLSNSLNVKNISKYINDIKNEKIDSKREMTDIREKKYFPMLKEANSYMQKFDNFNNKMNKKFIFKEITKHLLEVDDKDSKLEENMINIEDEIKRLKYIIM